MTRTLTDYSYANLQRFKADHPRARVIGNNTTVKHFKPTTLYPEAFHITYHQTEILRINRSTIHAYTGGWNTTTTRLRINRAMPQDCRVYQRDWKWYIDTPHVSGIKVRDRFTLRLLSDGTWNVVADSEGYAL